MAQAHGIAIAPGSVFSRSEGFSRHIRLNYGRRWTPEVESEVRTLGELATRLLAAAG
jgi:DNA-binding transcriptional MocR family regulator